MDASCQASVSMCLSPAAQPGQLQWRAKLQPSSASSRRLQTDLDQPAEVSATSGRAQAGFPKLGKHALVAASVKVTRRAPPDWDALLQGPSFRRRDSCLDAGGLQKKIRM